VRVYVSQINPIIGDIAGNSAKILNAIHAAKADRSSIVIFPELALTGYPPRDLLLLPNFMDAVEEATEELAKATYGITAIVGMPRVNRFKVGKPLHNSAAVISEGRVLGYHDKILLPTYDIFDERRYFEPGVRPWLWEIDGRQVAITICEDIWLHSGLLTYDRYTRNPLKELMMLPQRPFVLLNLSASPYSVAKEPMRMLVAQRAAKALHCPLIMCNQVGANDSLIFDGRSIALAYNGTLLQRAQGFHEDSFHIDIHAPQELCVLPSEDVLRGLFKALTLGIHDYFHKSGLKSACLGLSGGIDSAVVACLAVEALGAENVVAINMPSRYSSESGVSDSHTLAANLGIKLHEVPIEEPFKSYLALLKPYSESQDSSLAEENMQARIRGMILMAFSNIFGHLILNTGNKSELAMGYCTLYGDMCGSLSVIGDLTKRRVYALAQWINRDKPIIPLSIITRPPSAELRPGQLDSDSLPPYECIDTVIEEYLEYLCPPEQIATKHGYELQVIEDIIKCIHKSEYKRRQSPPGLRVTERAFSTGYSVPIVQKWVD
jgi:NAD+ synthase (glutamine-hydrolysing)